MQYCRRAQRCPGKWPYQATDGTKQWAGAETSRVLCDDCAAVLDGALGEFPELLQRLNSELARSLAVSYEGRVGGTQERRLPIREEVDALMHEIVDTARCWEEIVRDVAGDPVPDVPPVRAPETPDAGRSTLDRMFASLNSSVGLLRGRITALLALVVTEVDRDGWAELDGGDAALEFLDLHHRARGIVGEYRRTTHYPKNPCPNCGVPAVTHLDGSDIVRCQDCRQSETWERWCELIEQAA